LHNTTNIFTGPVKGISALTTKINVKALPMRCAEMAIQLKHAYKICFTKAFEIKQALTLMGGVPFSNIDHDSLKPLLVLTNLLAAIHIDK
jgi:hypothetical protein